MIFRSHGVPQRCLSPGGGEARKGVEGEGQTGNLLGATSKRRLMAGAIPQGGHEQCTARVTRHRIQNAGAPGPSMVLAHVRQQYRGHELEPFQRNEFGPAECHVHLMSAGPAHGSSAVPRLLWHPPDKPSYCLCFIRCWQPWVAKDPFPLQ